LAPPLRVVVAVVALELALVAVLLPAAVALVVLLLQFPARLLREAQLLRPVLLPEVAAVVLVQGLVASESLRSR